QKPMFVAEGGRTQTGLVASAGAACAFFCEEALLARVLQSHATLGKAHRCPMGRGLGKAVWESGLRDVRRRRRAYATDSTQDNVSVYRGNRRFRPAVGAMADLLANARVDMSSAEFGHSTAGSDRFATGSFFRWM